METENAIKLRLEVLTKPQILMFSATFIGGFLLFFICAMFAPTMIDDDSVTVQNCYSGSSCFVLEDGNATWTGRLNGVELENQVIVLRVIPESSEKLAYTSDIHVYIQGVESGTATEGDSIEARTEDYDIDCDSDSCDDFIVFYEPFIDYSYYLVKLTFITPIHVGITSMTFELGYISQEFTDYQLAIKYIFFFFSLVSLVLYLCSLRSVPFGIWSLESKLIILLSGSLVLFNEPLFAVNIYEPSEAIFEFSAFCISQFVLILLVFWIFLFQDNTKLPYKMWFYVVEGLLLFVFYVLMLVAYAYIHIHYRHEPSYDWNEDFNDNYKSAYIAFIVFMVFVAIILLVLIILSFPAMANLPKRKKVMTGLNIAMIVLTFIGLGIGAFQSNPKDGSIMLIYISGYNIYVFALAFLYAPNRVSIRQFHEQRNMGLELEGAPKEEPPQIIDEEIQFDR